MAVIELSVAGLDVKLPNIHHGCKPASYCRFTAYLGDTNLPCVRKPFWSSHLWTDAIHLFVLGSLPPKVMHRYHLCVAVGDGRDVKVLPRAFLVGDVGFGLRWAFQTLTHAAHHVMLFRKIHKVPLYWTKANTTSVVREVSSPANILKSGATTASAEGYQAFSIPAALTEGRQLLQGSIPGDPWCAIASTAMFKGLSARPASLVTPITLDQIAALFRVELFRDPAVLFHSTAAFKGVDRIPAAFIAFGAIPLVAAEILGEHAIPAGRVLETSGDKAW